MRAWYNVNTRKALETILWFVDKRDPIDYYHVLKVLFYADKKHLNEYGRPILGDTYEALPHGPVAKTVYALMKQDDPIETQFLAEQAGLQETYPILPRDRYWIGASRKPDLSSFAKSDLACLEWAFTEYAGKSFGELERLTHGERAWRYARERDGTIWYEDMLEPRGNNERGRMERQLAISAPASALRRTIRAA